MTFTTSLKEEISKNEYSILESRYEIDGFLKCFDKGSNEIIITLENASVARKMYQNFKKIYGFTPSITIRNQKRFRVKQIYILTLNSNIDMVRNNVLNDTLTTDEEIISYLRGIFLAVGNISNPQTSGYHLEFILNDEKFAEEVKELLNKYKFNAKIVKRGYKYVVYLKASENISDLLKMFKATSSMFFFEDIRIYRDHKNMVNRLNNCELSNQIKSTETGQKQLKEIKYIEDNDLLSLLDDKTKIIIEARKKYPESSMQELADIITLEYNYRIGKSGINHHFIKISNIVKRHKENNEVNDEN